MKKSDLMLKKRKLILVRHAKAESLALNDRTRRLSLEGESKAFKVAEHLKTKVELPTRWISSPAIRAYHTADIFLNVFRENTPYPQIKLEEKLYDFSINGLKEVICAMEDSYDRIILFGHNSAIPEFINAYTNFSIDEFAPSSVAILELELDKWAYFKEAKLKELIDSKIF